MPSTSAHREAAAPGPARLCPAWQGGRHLYNGGPYQSWPRQPMRARPGKGQNHLQGRRERSQRQGSPA
eukprot:CAMPEP_0197899280 /NCGR_PEP_ID=MMETSP1439-20131203/46107_1 /TAXON_ID=66791 /ORGANISM="Gonyaulax spinifera, Strain CCMP409" /LENGTH=67 /DNA_ID=CAMNT_0043520069 /DNA_START=48 /DNA_END=251 /DNA_ORIENTATION=-